MYTNHNHIPNRHRKVIYINYKVGDKTETIDHLIGDARHDKEKLLQGTIKLLLKYRRAYKTDKIYPSQRCDKSYWT